MKGPDALWEERKDGEETPGEIMAECRSLVKDINVQIREVLQIG